MALLMPVTSIRNVKHYTTRRDPPRRTEGYRQLFRFSEENVEYLANQFLPSVNETRGSALTEKQQMEITLRYLCDPGFQRSVGYEVGVTQSTVSKVLKDTLPRIAAGARDWITFPTTQEMVQNEKEKWFNKFNFPACIGAIDCTHVRIEKPAGEYGDEFLNRKGFPSINVQATCNADFEFTSVDSGWPGSVHDNRVFKNSEVYQVLYPSTHSGILIGDDGYGLTPFLITPYRNATTAQEKLFNKRHSKARVTIEQSFGQLKRRFPILRYGVRLKLDRVSTCITACFVLHNAAKRLNDPDDFQDEETENCMPEIHFENENFTYLRAKGQERRNCLKNIIATL